MRIISVFTVMFFVAFSEEFCILPSLINKLLMIEAGPERFFSSEEFRICYTHIMVAFLVKDCRDVANLYKCLCTVNPEMLTEDFLRTLEWLVRHAVIEQRGFQLSLDSEAKAQFQLWYLYRVLLQSMFSGR